MKIRELFEEKELPNSVLKLIKTKCSKFLNSTSVPMLRGISTDRQNKITNGNKFFMMEHIRTDRAPRDSINNPSFNFLFNLGAESITGISEIRKKTLFCTGEIATSEFYGRSFFVFPLNGFKFLSSPNVTDSFKNLGELQTDLLFELKKHKSDSVIDVYNFMNGPKVSEVFRQNGEISFNEFEKLTNKNARILLEKSLTNLFKNKYHYKTTGDLDSFLTKGAEVLIYDVPMAMLVNTTKLREWLIANPSLVSDKYRKTFERGSPMLDVTYAAFLEMIKES